MVGSRALMALLVVVSVSWLAAGCGRAGGVSANGRHYNADELAAQNAVMAEIRKHWVQGPDGWTTAMLGGTSFVPSRFLRQVKKLKVADVESNELSQSDKLNGFEWEGSVTFEETPMREAGDQGYVGDGDTNPRMVIRPKGQWSQWVSFTPLDIYVEKLHGKWQFSSGGMQTPITGRIPTPADYANAGVQ